MNTILENQTYKEFVGLLDENEIVEIENTVSSPFFPWYMSKTKYTAQLETIEKFKNNANVKEYVQLVHVFYNNETGDTRINSDFAQLAIKPLQKLLAELNLNDAILHRCKANFQTQHKNSDSDSYNTPHIDLPNPHYVMIYYVNDSDGDTFLFDNNNQLITRITPKRGKMLIFDGLILHAGSHPVTSDYRIVINYNFTV